jgi:two-component system sensor histidine kinase CiaH
MFRSLRLKLTLINVLVVGLIAVFFMAGVYLLMLVNTRQQSNQMMQLIASDAGSNTKVYPDRWERRWLNYFYVKVTTTGAVYEISPSIDLPPDRFNALVQEAFLNPKQQGDTRIKIDNKKQQEHYRYIKAPLIDRTGMIIVFLNAETEEEITGHLLGAFGATGFGVVTLALIGSFFLANWALKPIKKSWKRQKNFVADASHELRTPLAVIQTNLDVVKDNPQETVASQFQWLENIQIETNLMAKLVDDLLFLARADSNQEMIQTKPFSLSTALSESQKLFEPVAAQKSIKIVSEIEPHIAFNGDQTRIQQLISILIDNAIKYTPALGEISLKLKASGNHHEIIVSDNGEGIEKEHLQKIFERFYRVDKARSRQEGGIGLGLAIAEWIVKAHHGTLDVKSTPGKGTTFLIKLPKQD